MQQSKQKLVQKTMDNKFGENENIVNWRNRIMNAKSLWKTVFKSGLESATLIHVSHW
jgi:hypothetical protein